MAGLERMLIVCLAVVASYAAAGLPRRTVLLCSLPPCAFLALADVFLSVPYEAYLLPGAALAVCAAAAEMLGESSDRFFVLAGALFSVETALAVGRVFSLLDGLDAAMALILKLTAAAVILYLALGGRCLWLDRIRWLALRDALARERYRRAQLELLLALALQAAALAGMRFLWSGAAASLLLLCGYACCVWGLRSYAAGAALSCENEMLRDAQQSSQRFFHMIRSQRHDFMIHVHTIYGLLSSGQTEECRAYVEKLTEEARKTNEVIPLDKPAVCALLDEYLVMAERQRIALTYSIRHDLDQVACTEFELNRIIGNMLQNAFDEVSAYEAGDRRVRLLIIKRAGRSVIKVTNPFLRPQAELAGVMEMGVSTKRDHEGIGMKNVERIVKKYGGAFFIELEDGEFSAVAQIPDRTGQKEQSDEVSAD